MKRTLWTIGLAAALLCLPAAAAVKAPDGAGNAADAAAQDKPAEGKGAKAKAKAAAAPSHDDMMKAWQAYMTPGDPHKELAKCAGSWTTKTKSWMDPSNPKPEETDGSSEVTVMLGGRYVGEKFLGTMMGQPFEGFGITGYDNKVNLYQTFWIDSAGTGMLIMKGTADKTGKVITQTGTMVDPMSDKATKLKGVTTITDDDHRKFEMWMAGPDGKMFKSMEVVYTRKK